MRFRRRQLCDAADRYVVTAPAAAWSSASRAGVRPVTRMRARSSPGRAERDVVRHAAVAADQRGTPRIHDRIQVGLGGQVGGRFVGRRRFGSRRRRGRVRHGHGRRARLRLHHQADGAVLGPGGLVAGGVVRLALAALGLDAHQLRAGAAGLAHHAGGLGGAFEEQHGRDPAVVREAQAVHGVGVGGGDAGGEVGLVGVAGQQGGDVGDGGIVAVGESLGCVGDRRGEQAAEGVDDLVVDGAGEDERRVGADGTQRRGTAVGWSGRRRWCSWVCATELNEHIWLLLLQTSMSSTIITCEDRRVAAPAEVRTASIQAREEGSMRPPARD